MAGLLANPAFSGATSSSIKPGGRPVQVSGRRRAEGGGLVVVDKDAALEWARSQPVELGLVRIKEELSVKEFRAHCEPNGVVPPGCEWADETETVVVTAAGDALALTEEK